MFNRRPIIELAILLALCSISAAWRQRPSTPLSAGAAQATDATSRAVAAAEAFLGTLDQSQRAKANIDLNEKTRTIWSNLPSGITMQVGATERNGLKLGAMTPAQEKAALALVAATLSREGYQKAMEIVDADQVLEVQSAPTRKPGAPIRFGRAEYYVSILGTPSETDTWMLQFGGHHLAINVTLAGRENALTPEQQKQAILSFEVRNLVLGPGTDGRMITPEGVRASTFTSAQRTMLVELAREWVGILGDEAATAKMNEIQSGLADTYFAWAGPTTNGKGAYFRIQGPAVFIEYAPQGSGANNVDHIHTIYRDPTNDYAARMTRR